MRNSKSVFIPLLLAFFTSCAPGAGVDALFDTLNGKLPFDFSYAGKCFILEDRLGQINCPIYLTNSSDQYVKFSEIFASIGYTKDAKSSRIDGFLALPHTSYRTIATFENSGGRIQPNSSIEIFVSATETGRIYSATDSGSGFGKITRSNIRLQVVLGAIPNKIFVSKLIATSGLRNELKSEGYECFYPNALKDKLICATRIRNQTNSDLLLEILTEEALVVDGFGDSYNVSITIGNVNTTDSNIGISPYSAARIILKPNQTFDTMFQVNTSRIQSSYMKIRGVGEFSFSGIGYEESITPKK